MELKSSLVICGIIAFLSGIGCAIGATVLLNFIVADVNKQAPLSEQEHILFGYPGKVARILRKHERYYPQSNRRQVLRRLKLVTAALFVVGAALIFIPPNV